MCIGLFLSVYRALLSVYQGYFECIQGSFERTQGFFEGVRFSDKNISDIHMRQAYFVSRYE